MNWASGFATLRKWSGIIGLVLALCVLAGQLVVKTPGYQVAAQCAAGVFFLIWVSWVSVSCLRRRTTPPAKAFEDSCLLSRDIHTGWTGGRHRDNRYTVYIGRVTNTVELRCFMWTPTDFHGQIILHAPSGEKYTLAVDGAVTKHRAFPSGIGDANGGPITGEQYARAQEETLVPLIWNITGHVKSPGVYHVEIKYSHGSDGTWIQSVDVRTR
jgi:hypothetical protein